MSGGDTPRRIGVADAMVLFHSRVDSGMLPESPHGIRGTRSRPTPIQNQLVTIRTAETDKIVSAGGAQHY